MNHTRLKAQGSEEWKVLPRRRAPSRLVAGNPSTVCSKSLDGEKQADARRSLSPAVLQSSFFSVRLAHTHRRVEVPPTSTGERGTTSRHTQLGSTRYVASATAEPSFKCYLILNTLDANGHVCGGAAWPPGSSVHVTLVLRAPKTLPSKCQHGFVSEKNSGLSQSHGVSCKS